MLGRRILLGVTGGIAAYKAVYLARELVARGADLRVAMTPTATRLVGPATFAGLLGRAPVVDLWDPAHEGEIHVELSRWAEVFVIAPATANMIARLAHGLATDPVSATALCFDGPMLVAPAMHSRMWNHPATRDNVATLAARGVTFEGPVVGKLASGEEGPGRMSEPTAVADAIASLLTPKDLADLRLLVSAGPTYEAIDPVRFLGNRSSGRMGYAIAERARDRGAAVTLVSGPVALPAPARVNTVRVRSAREMREAIVPIASEFDAIVMAAAVADFRPREAAPHKLKKAEQGETPQLDLVPNPDILAELGASRLGPRPYLVGFAVETRDLVAAARDKLARKKVDLIVANHADVAFEGDHNEALLVTASEAHPTGRVSKRALADRILDVIGRWRVATGGREHERERTARESASET